LDGKTLPVGHAVKQGTIKTPFIDTGLNKDSSRVSQLRIRSWGLEQDVEQNANVFSDQIEYDDWLNRAPFPPRGQLVNGSFFHTISTEDYSKINLFRERMNSPRIFVLYRRDEMADLNSTQST